MMQKKFPWTLTKLIFPSYCSKIENIVDHPEDKEIFLIQLNGFWFSNVYVAKISNDSILRLTLISTECSDFARFVKLHGFDNYFIELYESSHIGNGSLHLFNLKDISSQYCIDGVLDFHHEDFEYEALASYFNLQGISFVYKDGCLEVNYNAIDNNGYSKLILTGVQQIKSGYEIDDVLYEAECKLVYEYNFDSNTFILDKNECVFPKYWFVNWNAIGEFYK